jgi:predicted regulator of Ras-like GTPase activity (Roadblock/LC7/MglB family)
VIDEALRGVRGESDGVDAVLLAGIDGVIVATAGSADGLAADAVAAAFADLFVKVGSAHRDAGLTAPRELTASTEDRRVVVRAVTPEYLLLAVLGERGILGQARHALSKAASALEAELA